MGSISVMVWIGMGRTTMQLSRPRVLMHRTPCESGRFAPSGRAQRFDCSVRAAEARAPAVFS